MTVTYGGNLGFNSRQTLQRMRVPSLPLRFSRAAEAYAACRVFRCGRQYSRKSSSKSRVNLAPETGPRAKMQNGAIHQARGGTDLWPGNGGDYPLAASSGWRWKAAIGHKLNSARRSVRHLPHPSGCSIIFQPYCSSIPYASGACICCSRYLRLW